MKLNRNGKHPGIVPRRPSPVSPWRYQAFTDTHERTLSDRVGVEILARCDVDASDVRVELALLEALRACRLGRRGEGWA